MIYLSILKRDPQLPFKLLPGNWFGDEAFYLAQKVRKSLYLAHGREASKKKTKHHY